MADKIVVDILQMELDQKLPYWLSGPGKTFHRLREITAKNRAKWLAEREGAGVRRAYGLDTTVRGDFDESEHPRDDKGQWTDKGGGDDGSAKTGSGKKWSDKLVHDSGAGSGANADQPHASASNAYAGRSPGNAQGSGSLKGARLKTHFVATEHGAADLKAKDATPVEFYELGERSGQVFHDAIKVAKDASKFGTSVSLYTAAEYDNVRTFLTPDGLAGFALNGDDIISAFRHPDSKAENVASSILVLATEQGGRRLEAFDTALPTIYGEAGFRAVARIAFDEQYQPDGWSRDTYRKYNDGRPDVVFMVHDPNAQAAPYQPHDGKLVAGYDAGVAAQNAALAEIDDRPGKIWWHGSSTGDMRGGATGLHLGTRYAAIVALGAQIGYPADGKGWTGDRTWGDTKLAGVKTLTRFGPYLESGFNAGSSKIDFPQEDFYAKDYIAKHPSERPRHADGSYLSFDAVPSVRPFQIVGGMTNTVDRPHDDFKANGLMKAQLTKGTAKNGFFYKNISEDEGSISAVVPSDKHLKLVKL